MTNDQKILMIIWQKPSKFCFVILLLKKKKRKKKAFASLDYNRSCIFSFTFPIYI